MRFFLALVSLFFIFSPTAGKSTAQAGVIVTVQDADIASGGTGFVDVLIRSDGTDNLAAFDYEFRIDDVGAPVGNLQFQVPQSLGEASDSNYVFAGDSGGILSEPENGPAFDEILGGDFTDSFGDVVLTTTDRLMVRLELEHVLPGGTDASAAAGDMFTISLVNGINTVFFDSGFIDPLTQTSDTPGTITAITAAVPEPGAAMPLLLAISTLLMGPRRRII